MMAQTGTGSRKRSENTPKLKANLRSERLRTFSPDVILQLRDDIAKVHGKPEEGEPTVLEFIVEFFDEIHKLREAKHPWSAIHESISKYVECSTRTLQSYYSQLAHERGLVDERNRRGRRRRKTT